MFLKFTTTILIVAAIVTSEPTDSKEPKSFKKSHFTGRRIESVDVPHVASKREAAPEPIYGVPAAPVYGPPPAAPGPEYGPPSSDYGAPPATGPDYGPPATAPAQEYGPPAGDHAYGPPPPVYGPPGHGKKPHKPEEVSLTEFLWDVFKTPIKTSITTAHKYDKKNKEFGKVLGLGLDIEFGKPKNAKYAPSHNYGGSKMPGGHGKKAQIGSPGSPLYAAIDTNVFGEYGKGRGWNSGNKKEEGWNAHSNSYGPPAAPSGNYGAPSGPSAGSLGWPEQFDANTAVEKLQDLCKFIGSGNNW